MKSRLSLTGWRLPLGIVEKPFSLGAFFALTFTQSLVSVNHAALLFSADAEEVILMKRFAVPRVAHCQEGCSRQP
jgi:hypothetical protein